MKDDLPILMQQMADLTLPECQKCPVPLSCCDSMYCEMALEYAKDEWGVTLERTNHPTLPLMGPNGCTAAPHLRPLCTLHTCKINALGTSRNAEWDKQYFDLREKIEEQLNARERIEAFGGQE